MVSADLEEYADVFSALAEEDRLELLLSICEECYPEGPIRFSEAMEAAEFEDSGRFSYHLDQLRENFVHSQDDAYDPTIAAWEVYVAMRTGRLADNDVGIRRAPLEATCLGCGHRLQATYRYEFYVCCPRCERGLFAYPVGPDVVADADLAALARELDRADRSNLRSQIEHRCQRCGGEADVWFLDDLPSWHPTTIAVGAGCSNCRHLTCNRTVGSLLLALPAVQDYCEEHEIDLHERPQWAYDWTRRDAATTVHSRDPWRVEQYAHVDGRRLRVVIGDDAAVEAIDHVPLRGETD